MKKITHLGLLLVIIAILFWACSKDDSAKPTPEEENTAPVIEVESISVAEDIAPGDEITKITATDDDGDTLKFTLTGENPFAISEQGILTLAEDQHLDYESTKEYSLNVSVNDGRTSAGATLTLTVTDVNEAPFFEVESLQFGTDENKATTEPIGTVMASDPEGDELTYTISENTNDLFAIDPATGQISVAGGKTLDIGSFNGEEPVYHITVKVTDKEELSATIAVSVSLAEVDPAFEEESYVFEVPEDKTEIGTVTATDPQQDPITFSIVQDQPEIFEISEEGTISLVADHTFDYDGDEATQYEITVTASDTSNNTTEVTVTINVTDVDEVPFLTSNTEFDADENVADDIVIAQLTATDPEGGNITFSMTHEVFEITETGDISLVGGQELDYEDPDALNYELTVEVSDGTNTVEYTVSIQVQDVNEAPVIVGPTDFEVLESISDVAKIGTIFVDDPEDDNLTFDITMNDDNLFEINNAGELSLANLQSLDFENAQQHQITVQVSDNHGLNVETQVNITVTDSFADEDTPFITTWETTQANEEVIIGTSTALIYNFTVDWGDGNIQNVNLNGQGSFEHTYESPGIYTVAILGDFPSLRMSNILQSWDKEKLRSIEQWGNIEWETMRNAFNGCSNMVYNASDVPDLTLVTNLGGMFSICTNFNGDLSNWNTGNITHMDSMFLNSSSFEGNGLENWDTGAVTTTELMFYSANVFNSDLGNWNIESMISARFIFSNTGMSSSNYGATLVGWATQNNTPNNVDMTQQFGMTYCSDNATVQQARQDLFNLGWQISGDNGVNCNQP